MMEAFLKEFNIERLGPKLKEQGIEEPKGLEFLEAEDINEFLQDCAQSGMKIKLSEKAGMRKAFKAIKEGTWGKTDKNPEQDKKGHSSKPQKSGCEQLRGILKELNLQNYQEDIEDPALWKSGGASLEEISYMSHDEREALLEKAGVKPGHRAKLLRRFQEFKAVKPYFLSDMKVDEILNIGKGKLGLGSELGHNIVRMLKQNTTGNYSCWKGKLKIVHVLPKKFVLVKYRSFSSVKEHTANNRTVVISTSMIRRILFFHQDISASFFRGSVSIDDSQKSRMLGKGVQFSIWQYGDGKALLWNANTWISTSSEKKSFELLLRRLHSMIDVEKEYILYRPDDGSTIELRVECKGLNVNAPAIWINPRFEAPMDGEKLPARPIPNVKPPPPRPYPIAPTPALPRPPINMLNGPRPRPRPRGGLGRIMKESGRFRPAAK
eukprot:jgi/Bigna1/140696/aug1.57_g15404